MLSPALGIAAIVVSAYGLLTGNGMEAAIWGSVAVLGVLLVAGFADIAAKALQNARLAAAGA